MKSKKVADENAPLLPTKRQDEGGFDEFHGASFSGAVFNLSTTVVGAGIMALPSTMNVLGLCLGIFMIVFMAFLTERSIDMLLEFSRAAKSSSYAAVMQDGFGKVGRILVQVSVLVNNIGVLMVYMIITGDLLSGTSSSGMHHAGVLEGWFGSQWWNGRLIVLLVTTLCVFAPLACFKRIDSLSYTSALSVGLAVVFLVIMVGIAVIKLLSGTVMMPKLLPNVMDMNSFWKLFTVVPVLVTAYICHYNVHSIDNELEESTQIKGVVCTALALCSSVYVMTSLFGFLMFGDGTLDDVLANFDTDLGIPYGSVLNDAVRVSYAAHLMIVFLIFFYPLSNFISQWLDSPSTIIPLLKDFISKGHPVWIYSGDTDGRIPVTSTRQSIDIMGLPIKTKWHPWYIKGEVGVYTQVYEGNLTFATIRGAGHQVPSYQPLRALAMIMHFLDGTPLPDTTRTRMY